jgi:integrase
MAKISGVSIAKVDANKVVIPKNANRRVVWWRVTLGKKITGAKKVRRFFATESAAKKFVDDTFESREHEGHEAFLLTPAFRLEARKCQEMLDEAAVKTGRHLSLTEAVGFFMRHALPQGGTKTFVDAANAFLANRRTKNLRPRYVVNLESQFRTLNAEFGERRVNVISPQMIESWLARKSWSPKTRNNYVITLRTFFAYCVKYKWCAENPAEALEKAESEDSVAGILTVTEAARILDAGREFSDTLPVLAIQLFAGLRRSEACALDWSELRGNVIEVTARKSKTRARRVVDIQPVLAAWLRPFAAVGGRVFARGEDCYNDRLREILEAANKYGGKQQPPWPAILWKHNCLRHTCASMQLAHFSNDAYTALQLGHSVEVLHRHYKGLVLKEDAARFWELLPRRVIEQDAEAAV